MLDIMAPSQDMRIEKSLLVCHLADVTHKKSKHKTSKFAALNAFVRNSSLIQLEA